ncbi:MAG: CBS domain-containing protein [Sphingomicrobium sp.]
MTIADVLRRKGAQIETTTPAVSLAEAIAQLGARRIGALPVMDNDDGVVGMFSERDVIFALRDHGPDVLSWTVERIMTSPVVTVGPDHDVLAALGLMTDRRIRHLPVCDNGRLVGIVSIGDLVKHRLERIEAEAAAMRSYIQSA